MAEMTADGPRPTLTPTRSGASWRLPALAVGIAVVGLVVLSRLVGSERPTATLAPSAVAAMPTATSAPTSTPIVGNQLEGVISRSPDGLTYVDGIPTGISGQPVYRVRDVLLVPLGRTMLVGGWYIEGSCRSSGRSVRCLSPALSDAEEVELVGEVIAHKVALDAHLNGAGAHIVLATIEADPGCGIYRSRACPPRLHVIQAIWSG